VSVWTTNYNLIDMELLRYFDKDWVNDGILYIYLENLDITTNVTAVNIGKLMERTNLPKNWDSMNLDYKTEVQVEEAINMIQIL
jgi:hypothetical protein